MNIFKKGMKGFKGVNFDYTKDDKKRKMKEISKLENIMFDRIWYERSQINNYEAAKPAQERIRKQYGKDFLPLSEENSDFDWGYLNGILATLRWVLGDEMDNLDS